MGRTVTHCCAAGLTLVAVALSGCHSPDMRAAAAREVGDELAAREERMQQSMVLYRAARDAEADGDAAEALERLGEAIATCDRNAPAWMLQGVLQAGQDEFAGAAKSFQAAVRLAPTRYEPHFNLGKILETAGRHLQAARKYEVALRLAPDQLEVMENLARCYIRTKTESRKARELIGKALELEVRPEWVRWLRAQERLLDEGRRER